MSWYEKALEFALKAHTGQFDRAGVPYILHPLRIALKHEGHPTLFAVGLLHDTVEDTFGKPNEITLADINREFGGYVAEAVDSLTRRSPGMVLLDGSVADHAEDYLAEYLPRLLKNPIARIIKRDDLGDNLSTARDASRPPSLKARYSRALAMLKEAEKPAV